MKKLKKETNQEATTLLELFPYLFVFIASLSLPRDPDLGWHLRYGEYVLSQGHILKENIFSTMMPNVYWVNGSWASDIFLYAVYATAGFLGITVLSAVIVTLTFYFFAKASKFSFIEKALFFPLFVYVLSPLNSYSFRTQQLSMLFLGILLFLLSRYTPFSKILLFVPLVFFFWFNMHQESVLGLVVLVVYIFTIIITRFFSKDKNISFQESMYLCGVVFSTVFISLLNPFGVAIYHVAFSHMINPLIKTISEYIAFTPFSAFWWHQISAIMFVLFCIVYFLKQKLLLQTFFIWFLPASLLLLSLNTQRYICPGYYLLFPLIPCVFPKNIPKKILFHGSLMVLLCAFVFTTIQKFPFTKFTKMSWETYCTLQKIPCSPSAAQFLKTHPEYRKNLYTYYDWGGWLIWNYPMIKPSIDGRMHLWKDTTGFMPAKEYAAFENGEKNIDTSTYTTVFLPLEESPLYFQLNTLINQRTWHIVYQDEYTAVVTKIK